MSVVVERRGFSLPLGVSPEAEIFAVGDIHGRSDLLVALIDEAAREPKLRDKRTIVFLGDFVDRGSDSLGAIELAMGAKARVGADEAIALMGNHEAMMRLALDPETPWDDAIDAFDTWIANGGDRTLAQSRRARRFPRASAPGSSLHEQVGARATFCSFTRASTQKSNSRLFLPLPGTFRSISSTKIVIGPGFAGRSSSIVRGRTVSAASSSSTATRQTTRVATPRTPIRSPDSDSISTRVRR
jgi:hypothetical protein